MSITPDNPAVAVESPPAPVAAMRMPVVAIVGRPNVGKSSLLNALAGKLVSIVQDMPGVTRDRISYPLPVPSGPPSRPDYRYVELLDTGGYGFHDPTGLTEHIRHQIEMAMARADLVLFTVDCLAGLTPADETIAQMLRSRGLKVALVANKADGDRADVALADFSRLGFGTPVGISALNGRNLDDVFKAIARNLDLKTAPREIPPPEMLVAIVGKRNAGKSTLVNAVARLYEGDTVGDRVIVSEVPGTTRDSVDVRFEKDGHVLTVIDTAGVRKKRMMVATDIDFYSFHRAERSIRRADIVLLLVDATEPVSEPDKKLARYIHDEYKPTILVVNKWDLAKTQFIDRAKADGRPYSDHDAMEAYRTYLDAEFQRLDYAPIAFTSARDGRNVQAVIDLCQHLFKQAHERVSTGKLNAAIRQVFEERFPPTKLGKRARVYYATQTGVNPPEIVLFVNNPLYISDNYQRFMIRRFRELLPYAEVPIKLAIRGKEGASNSKAVTDSAHTHAPAKRKKMLRKGAESKADPSLPRKARPSRAAGKPKPISGGSRPVGRKGPKRRGR